MAYWLIPILPLLVCSLWLVLILRLEPKLANRRGLIPLLVGLGAIGHPVFWLVILVAASLATAARAYSESIAIALAVATVCQLVTLTYGRKLLKSQSSS